jgi:hypothetical protein
MVPVAAHLRVSEEERQYRAAEDATAARHYDGLVHGAGQSLDTIAAQEGIGGSYFTRVARLAWLAPGITEAVLHGRQPADLNARKLMADTRAPIHWHEQRAGLGFI